MSIIFKYYILIRKIYRSRVKNFSSSSSSLGLFCLFVNFYFLLTLFFFFFGQKYFQIYNLGIPLGPVVKAVSFVLLILFSVIRIPFSKSKFRRIREAFLATQSIERKYVIIYVIISVLMLPTIIYLTILGQK